MAIFTNQATLTYAGLVQNSNIVTGELVEALSITKNALTGSYAVGDTVTYIVNIANTNTAPYTALTLTDNLGGTAFNGTTVYPLAYNAGSIRYYVNGTLQPAPAVTAGPPLSVSGITIPAGGNAILVYSADVTAFAPLATGDTITNTATLAGAGLAEAITATETVTAADGVDLRITKAISPASVSENDTVTYTLTIENYGNAAVTADGDAVITDTFNPILSNLAVTFNGAALTEGTQYTYDEGTGLFTTSAGTVTVPAATYVQNPATGAYTVVPGISVLQITGTV